MAKIIQCLKFATKYVGVRVDEAKNTGIDNISLSLCLKLPTKIPLKALRGTELVTSWSHSPEP